MLLNMTQHAHNVASKQQQQAQGAHPPLTMIPASNNSVSNNAAATIPNSNNNNNNNATTYTPGATSLYNQPLSAANIYIPQGVHPPVGAATAAVYPAMIPTSNVYVNNVTANVNLHGWPHTVPAYISGGAPHYIHGEVPTDQNGPILQSMPAIQPVALTTSNAIAVQSSASSSSGLSTRGSRRGRGRGGSSGSRRGDYNAQRNPPSESSPAPGQQPQQQPQNQDQSLGQQPQQTSTQQQQQLEVVQPAYAPHPQYTSPYQYATYPAAYFSPQNHILHPAQAATQPATGQPLYVPIYPGHQLYNYQYIPQMMNPGEYQFVPGDDVQCDERQNADGMVPQIWHHQSMYPEEYAMNTADMQADEINQNAPSLTSSETPSMLSPNYHIYDPQIHEMQQQMSVMQIYDDQQITQITGMHPGGAIPELQDEISECGVPNAAIQMVSTSAMLAPIHMQGDSHIMHHHMHDPSQQAPPHHLIPAPIVAIETHQQVELAAEHVMVDSYVDSTEIATLQSSDSNTNLSEINQQSCESISQEYQQQVAVDELHQQQQPETIVSHYSSHNVSTSSELPSETSELQQNLPTTEPAVTPISERADAALVQQQPQPHSFVPSTFTHHHHQQHRQQMEQQQVDFHQQEQQQCEEEQQDQLEQQQQQQDHQLEHQQLENQQQEHHHQDYQQRDYQQQDYQQQDYQQQDYQQQDYQQQDYQQQDYQQQDYQQQEYQQQDYQQQEQQQQDYEQQEYEQQEHQQQEHQHSELEHYEQQMRRPQRLDAQHQQTRQQDTQHLEHQQHGQQQLPLHQQKQTHQHHQKYQYNNHQQYSEHESCEQHEKQQQYQSQQHHQYFPKHQRSYYSHQNDQQQPYRKQSYHYTQRNYIPRFHNNNNANNQHQHQSNMSGNSSDNSLQTTKSMSWTKSYQKKSTASVSVTATPAANNKTMSGTYIHGTKSYTNHQHHYQQQHQHHYPHQSQHHYNYQQQQPHTRNHGAMKTPSSPTMNTSGPHFERRQNQGESYYQRPTSTSTASTTAVPQQFQNQDQRQQQTSSQSEYTSYVTKHAHSHQNQNYYLNKKNSAAATTSAEPTPPAAPTMNLAPPQPAGGAATSVSSPNTWASLFNNKSSRAPSSTFTVTPNTQSSATVAQPNTVPSASNGTATSIKKPVAKVAPYEGITPTSPAPPLVTPGSMSYSAASAQNLVPAATASATSVATTAADRPAKPEPALPSKSLDEWSVKFADFLTKHKTDLAPISLRPRGLTNRSNYCYINSILQALLGCAPFYNLIRAIPKQAAALCDVKTPTINAMLSFMGNFSSLPSGVRLNNRLNKAGPKGKDSQGSELQCDSAFEPTEIYRLWNESRDEHVEGRQEDAEEFLGYVLNKLNDEMLEVIKLVAKPGDQNGHDPQSENEDGDAWQMICNNRNKGSVTRQTDFGRTPLSDIFRGELRSRLQREGEISTDVIQPFFTLQLNIEKAASVKEALEILVGRDQLEGVTGSKSKQEVVAWQQMTLEKLPVVLILHLKWFDYRSDGCTKILKTVEFPVELKIDPKILASKKYSQKQRTYRLFAVVYHDGKEASKGHYITDVYHTGYSNWLRFDDSSVKPVGEQNVLHPHMPRVPYLLYYRRYDTLPQAFASTGYQSGSTAAAQAGTRDAK